MDRTCEDCGSLPPPNGLNGTWGLHDYCAHCSKNLCESCLKKPCPERAEDGLLAHEVEEQ